MNDLTLHAIEQALQTYQQFPTTPTSLISYQSNGRVLVLGDDAEPLALPNPVGPTILSADDLTGDFQYWAVDAGTTPMSDLARQAVLERIAPLLVQLGTPPAEVLAELVRAYQLPESFLAAPPPPENTPPQSMAAGQADAEAQAEAAAIGAQDNATLL